MCSWHILHATRAAPPPRPQSLSKDAPLEPKPMQIIIISQWCCGQRSKDGTGREEGNATSHGQRMLCCKPRIQDRSAEGAHIDDTRPSARACAQARNTTPARVRRSWGVPNMDRSLNSRHVHFWLLGGGKLVVVLWPEKRSNVCPEIPATRVRASPPCFPRLQMTEE